MTDSTRPTKAVVRAGLAALATDVDPHPIPAAAFRSRADHRPARGRKKVLGGLAVTGALLAGGLTALGSPAGGDDPLQDITDYFGENMQEYGIDAAHSTQVASTTRPDGTEVQLWEGNGTNSSVCIFRRLVGGPGGPDARTEGGHCIPSRYPGFPHFILNTLDPGPSVEGRVVPGMVALRAEFADGTSETVPVEGRYFVVDHSSGPDDRQEATRSNYTRFAALDRHGRVIRLWDQKLGDMPPPGD